MKEFAYKKGSSGSFVVEASIVFPIVIFVIFLIMYICFLLYQLSSLQTIANEAAEKGAASWNNALEFKTSFVEALDNDEEIEDSLYWRFYDSSKEDKLETVKNYIKKELRIDDDMMNHGNGGRSNIQVSLDNHFRYKALVVNISRNIKTPFDQVLQLFGSKEGIVIKVKAQSVIVDNTELIRNADFILDIVDEIDTNSKIKDFMNKMKKVIGSFF